MALGAAKGLAVPATLDLDHVSRKFVAQTAVVHVPQAAVTDVPGRCGKRLGKSAPLQFRFRADVGHRRRVVRRDLPPVVQSSLGHALEELHEPVEAGLGHGADVHGNQLGAGLDGFIVGFCHHRDFHVGATPGPRDVGQPVVFLERSRFLRPLFAGAPAKGGSVNMCAENG